MRRLINKIRQHEFFRNAITLATGSVVAQAIPLLIAPILTRLYSPEDFGLLAVFMSITALLSIAATGRYEVAIVLPANARRARRLLRLAILLTLIFSTAVGIVITLTHGWLTPRFDDERMALWLYFIPLAVLLTGVFESLRYYAVRKKEFQPIATALTWRSSTDGAFQLGAGFAGAQSFGLIPAYLTSLFAGNIRLWRIFRKDVKQAGEQIADIIGLKLVAGRYRNFPKFSLPAQLLNSASLQLPVFVFSLFFSGTIVGWYALAQRVLNAPMTIIGSAIGQVFFQKAAEHKNDPLQLSKITWGLYRTLLIVGIIPLGIILVFGDVVFGWIFGAAWITAGEYAQVLSIWILFVFISSPLSNLFFVQEKQRQGLVLQAIIFGARFLVLLGCILLQADAYRTVLLFGVIGAVIFFAFVFYLLASVGIRKISILTHTIFVVAAVVIPLLLIRQLLCR